MINLNYISIKTKLTLIFIVLIIIVGSIIFPIIHFFVKNNLLQEVQKREIAIAKFIAKNQLDSVLTENIHNLQLAFSDLMQQQNINYIFVLTQNNEVLLHTFKKGFPVELKSINNVINEKDYNIDIFETETGEISDISISLKGGYILRLGITLDSITQNIQNITNQLLIILFLLVTISLLIMIFISNKIIQPVVNLTGIIKNTTLDTLTSPIKTKSNDEVGILTDAFNTMRERLKYNKEEIQSQSQKLQKLNETLEQRVKEEVYKNREKEKQLLHQSRLAQMGEMISMIAHQWRQPLAAISSTAGTLKLDILMDNYKKEFFEKSLGNISDYSQHLSSTINDFRNFFKDNKEQKETTLEEIIENSLDIIGATLDSDNIKLIKKYECNEIFYNYPNELKQVVLNLIKNAEDVLLEHNIKNPTIYLKTYVQKNKYILEVSDNAGGIPKDIMHNIFMPYFSTKKNKEGTGLGLYMSKTIIEDNCNGKLYFKNSDEGAVFTIELKSILKGNNIKNETKANLE